MKNDSRASVREVAANATVAASGRNRPGIHGGTVKVHAVKVDGAPAVGPAVIQSLAPRRWPTVGDPLEGARLDCRDAVFGQ